MSDSTEGKYQIWAAFAFFKKKVYFINFFI